MRRVLLGLALALAGCGSVVTAPGGDGGGAASSTSSSGASSSASTGDGGQGDGWTECSSPEGYRLCKGPANCDVTQCDACYDEIGYLPQPISICINDEFKAIGWDDWYLCQDGKLLIDTHVSGSYIKCLPYNLGVLFANAGYADWVRYADFGLFTGEPIPAPTSCPTIEGVPLCGGHCGGCPAETTCTGRSPLHPYGICATTDTCRPAMDEWCGAGRGCFIWTVEPEAQALADQQGYCYPQDICEKMAAEVPGGGKCVVN